jgi:hypothetical protein
MAKPAQVVTHMLFSAIQPVLHDPISLDGPWRHVHKGAFSLVLTCPHVLTGCFYLTSAAPEGVLAAPVLRTSSHSRGRYLQGGRLLYRAAVSLRSACWLCTVACGETHSYLNCTY